MRRSVGLLALLALALVAVVGRSVLQSGAGLAGEYVADARWGGEVRKTVDPQPSAAAMARAWTNSPPSQFRARWSGFLVVTQGGWYTFALASDDGSAMSIDGIALFDGTSTSGFRTETGHVRLTRGAHPVRIDYVQTGGAYELNWSWARDGGSPSSVPAWALWSRPVTYRRALAAATLAPMPWIVLLAFSGLALWSLWHTKKAVFLAAPLRLDWALVLIVVFGAYFRLQYVQLPIAEAHTWRQITNTDVARNFNEVSLNILYPQVSWGGAGESYVSMEFPLLQWIAAVLFRMFGEHDIICRGVAIAFSLATLVGLYGLATCLWGRAVGRGAAFLYAISPSAIFFGRTFISDVPMVCFSAFGVWGFASYLRSGRRAPLIWGTVTAALACLVKVPAVLILAPITYMAWETKRWAVLRDRALLGGLTTVVLLTAAWYIHAELLFQRTGLGEAIWHASGGYNADVMEGAGRMLLVSHWSTLQQLRDPEFYSSQLQRLWTLHLTPIGFVLAIVGALLSWRAPRRRVVDVWFGTVVLFILVSAEGNRWHEFHQLPILLPAALYFGLGARWAFDGGWLGRAPLRLGLLASATALWAIGVLGVRQSAVIPNYFRPRALNFRPRDAGQLLQELTPPRALVLTVEYDRYGGNSPILLYHARRRGWSFDVDSITPHVVEHLHSAYGARYFVTMIWSHIVEQRPELARYLETQERIPLDGPADVALFALR